LAGNVRELENIVRKALLASRGYPISLENLRTVSSAPLPAPPAHNQGLPDYIAELLAGAQAGESDNIHEVVIAAVERELYGQAIRLAGGDQSRAARWLGVSRPTMREKLIRYGLFPVRQEPSSMIRFPARLARREPGSALFDV
jgi:DNA-binding NtrC family response regulator